MSGVASKAFLTLIENNIPFYQTTTSEISISYVIDDFNGQQAVENYMTHLTFNGKMIVKIF